MKKQIKLAFDPTLTGLAGFPLGTETFNEQVKIKITDKDYKEGFEIIFPTEIKRIASSFVQGFFSEPIQKLGFYDMKEKIKLTTSSEKLTQSILEVLE